MQAMVDTETVWAAMRRALVMNPELGGFLYTLTPEYSVGCGVKVSPPAILIDVGFEASAQDLAWALLRAAEEYKEANR
jgi:hypothetical protein